MKVACFIDSITGNLSIMYPQYNDKLRFINHPDETKISEMLGNGWIKCL